MPLPRRSPIKNRTPMRKALDTQNSNPKYRLWNANERKKLVMWIRVNLHVWNGKGPMAGKIRRCIEEVPFSIEVNERSIKHCLAYLKRTYIATKKKWYETTGAGLSEDSIFNTIEGHNYTSTSNGRGCYIGMSIVL